MIGAKDNRPDSKRWNARIDSGWFRIGTAGGGPATIILMIVTVIMASFLCALVINVLYSIKHFYGVESAKREIYAFSLLCTFLSLWLVLGQVFAYLRHGQQQKLTHIKQVFSADVIARYLLRFCTGSPDAVDAANKWIDREKQPNSARDEELESKLEGLFFKTLEDNFGISAYKWPALIFVAVAFVVLFMGFAGGISFAEKFFTTIPPAAPLGLRFDLVSISAIFGALTYIGSDAVSRNHLWNFHPSDLSWYTLRLIVAVPLGQAVALAFGTAVKGTTGIDTGAFMAFVIAMFSWNSITSTLTTAAAKLTGGQTTTPAERDDVVLALPGIDQSIADDLSQEGVATILQLTTADPVRISIRTSLYFDYVLYLIDSAILWKYMGAQTPSMRPFGFPNATHVLQFLGREQVKLKNALSTDEVIGKSDTPSPSQLEAASQVANKRELLANHKNFILSSLSPDGETLISDTATALCVGQTSKFTASGIKNVFASIIEDPSAQFLHHIQAKLQSNLTAKPSLAKSETPNSQTDPEIR